MGKQALNVAIDVFGMGEKLRRDAVKNQNVNKTQLGGWSQARYQRHIENYYLHHAKEVVDALDKAVRDYVGQYLIPGLRLEPASREVSVP